MVRKRQIIIINILILLIIFPFSLAVEKEYKDLTEQEKVQFLSEFGVSVTNSGDVEFIRTSVNAGYSIIIKSGKNVKISGNSIGLVIIEKSNAAVDVRAYSGKIILRNEGTAKLTAKNGFFNVMSNENIGYGSITINDGVMVFSDVDLQQGSSYILNDNVYSIEGKHISMNSDGDITVRDVITIDGFTFRNTRFNNKYISDYQSSYKLKSSAEGFTLEDSDSSIFGAKHWLEYTTPAGNTGHISGTAMFPIVDGSYDVLLGEDSSYYGLYSGGRHLEIIAENPTYITKKPSCSSELKDCVSIAPNNQNLNIQVSDGNELTVKISDGLFENIIIDKITSKDAEVNVFIENKDTKETAKITFTDELPIAEGKLDGINTNIIHKLAIDGTEKTFFISGVNQLSKKPNVLSNNAAEILSYFNGNQAEAENYLRTMINVGFMRLSDIYLVASEQENEQLKIIVQKILVGGTSSTELYTILRNIKAKETFSKSDEAIIATIKESHSGLLSQDVSIRLLAGMQRKELSALGLGEAEKQFTVEDGNDQEFAKFIISNSPSCNDCKYLYEIMFNKDIQEVHRALGKLSRTSSMYGVIAMTRNNPQIQRDAFEKLNTPISQEDYDDYIAGNLHPDNEKYFTQKTGRLIKENEQRRQGSVKPNSRSYIYYTD